VSAAAVLFVHGLWMTGHESLLLRWRLRKRSGHRTQVYHYRSVRDSIAHNADGLRAAMDRIDAPVVHLVGHSLGGLVILRCLHTHTSAPPGRVVFLGTPCGGSRAARVLESHRWGRALMGHAASEELLVPHARRWDFERPLGIIAGTAGAGLGRLLLSFGEANDGTITVAETRIEGASGHLCLPVTHSTMLISARVARATADFLEYGTFGN
jgi:pimeloyl-ACP methyl ester carboxylesterase